MLGAAERASISCVTLIHTIVGIRVAVEIRPNHLTSVSALALSSLTCYRADIVVQAKVLSKRLHDLGEIPCCTAECRKDEVVLGLETVVEGLTTRKRKTRRSLGLVCKSHTMQRMTITPVNIESIHTLTSAAPHHDIPLDVW